MTRSDSNKARQMKLQAVLNLLIAFILKDCAAQSGTKCPPDLKNLVVYRGDVNTLLESSVVTSWYLFPTFDDEGSYKINDFDDNMRVDPQLTGLFYVNQSGLVILNATTTAYGGHIATAGRFEARCYGDDHAAYINTTVKFVVVLHPPACSSNDSSPEAVRLSCTISYADEEVYPIYANMTWKVGGVFHKTETPNRTASDGRDGNHVWVSTSTISVDNSVAADYECIVTFNAPIIIGEPLEHPTRGAPKFSASCPVSGYCFPNLKNVAVREGTPNIEMNVTASPCTVAWSVTPTSDESTERQITGPACATDLSLAGLYNANGSGLIIKNSTATANGYPISTAGLYVANCQNNGNRAGAKLLVVRSGPNCSCKHSSGLLGILSYNVSCSVVYADSSTRPISAIMIWNISGNPNKTDASPKIQKQQNVITATSSITVSVIPGLSLSPSYQCALTFGQPSSIAPDYIASNAPEFSGSCSGTCPLLK